MNGSELLYTAGALVASGWCQGAEARTAAGAAVPADAPDAASWSLLGALQAAAVADTAQVNDIAVAVAALADLIVDPSLAHWNDVTSRTQQDVVAILANASLAARTDLGAGEFVAYN